MAPSIARQPQQRCQVQGRTGKLTTNVAHSSDTDLLKRAEINAQS